MNILLVDDGNLYRSILGKSLGAEGIALQVAGTGREALELAAATPFQLVAISMQLGDTDGVALTRRLRALPHYSHVPILILTVSASRESSQHAVLAGVTEIFRKQDLDELLNFIRRFLARYRSLHGRILYVEDARDQRLAMTTQLADWGLAVDALPNADAAWEVFLRGHHDLVITDIVLDGSMSGSRFVNRIRRLPGEKGEIPILAVTAFDTPARRSELFHLGVSDYVTKPILAEELHARIQNLISAKHVRDRDQSLLNATTTAVITIDEQGVIQFCNAEARRIFGHAEADMLGRDVGMLMPEPHRSAHGGHIARYLNTGESRMLNGLNREMPALHRDGRVFPIQLTVTEMDHFGRRVFVGMIRDISLEKRAEEQMREAVALAERASRSKTEFLANMSHEIRTPLNALLGLAQVGLRENLGARPNALFQRMLESGRILQGIVDDILDFSKIEAGKLAIETGEVCLDELLTHVIHLTTGRAEDKGLPLRARRGAGLPDWFRGDALRLAQVLVNLLANAIKFTERGEVSLEVAREDDRLLFRVRDTGIGMAPEQLERLFQPFEQAESSTTRRYGGTGLGLAISRRLVELMGGEIRVESRLGQGSVFQVGLPLEAVAAPERSAVVDTAGGDPRLVGVRVLAAEDNAVSRLVLEEILALEGAVLSTVEDGRQLLERLAADGPEAWDIVLTDIQMPHMDGYEACRQIKALAPALPVIGLTAHALEEERQRCLECGMVDHVAKPVDLDRLVAAILRHLAVPPGAAAAPAPQPPHGRADSPGQVDWTALRAVFPGNREFVGKLIAVALAAHRDSPDKLRQALAARDLPGIAFIAHAIKGMSGNLEAQGLREWALRTEQAARAGTPEALPLAETLLARLEGLLAELEAGPPGMSLDPCPG